MTLYWNTDVSGKFKQIPVLPANKQLEAIFLVIAETDQAKLSHYSNHSSASTRNFLDALFKSVIVIYLHLRHFDWENSHEPVHPN
jgi:hypothetical protein